MGICEVQKIIIVNTPHGKGQILFLLDYGEHYNTIWVVALTTSGEIKHYNSNQITIEHNHTLEFNINNDQEKK